MSKSTAGHLFPIGLTMALLAATTSSAFEVQGVRSGEPIADVAARLRSTPGMNVQQGDGSITFWREDPMQWVEVSSCEGKVSSVQFNLAPGLWSTAGALEELIAKHGQPERVMARGASQLEQNRRADVSYFWRASGEVIELSASAFTAGGQEREQLSVITTTPSICGRGLPD